MRIVLAATAFLVTVGLANASAAKHWGADDLRRELIAWFEKSGREAPSSESIGPLDPRMNLVACENLSIAPRSVNSSSFLLKCSAPVDWRYVLSTDGAGVANRSNTIAEQGAASKRWPVIVAATSLSAGMVLTEGLMEESFVASPPSPQALKSLRQATGMRLTASVASGAVLTTRNVARTPLVLKGEMITIMAGGQGFEIATPAKADEDGYEGDLIAVKNARTGAAMKGRLQRDKTVIIAHF